MALQSASPASFFAIPRLPGMFSNDGAVAGGAFGSLLVRGEPTRWSRFLWQSKALSSIQADSSEKNLIRPATREEGEDVLRVILLSLSMDSGWNDAFPLVEGYLKAAVARTFNATEPLCLVIPKGNRLIAASLLDPEPEAENHLLSGPTVLMEYRNRGLGTSLLQASLHALRERGLSSVAGITREKTSASRHVYPKFGSVSEPAQFSSLMEVAKEAKS